MPRLSILAAVLTGTAATLICAAAGNDASPTPVLLELFTSEGCSSCPPADRLLATLDEKQPVAGAELIVLSEHVDYWNRLGWKDPYSSSEYTARQQDYTNMYHLDGVYTPQLVVDGRFGLVGSDAHQASSAIQQAIRDRKIPIAISNVAHDGDQVRARIELPAADRNIKAGRGVLYVAIADNRAESHVTRGENAGRALAHVAVTRVLKQVGTINLDRASVKEVAVTVQAGVSGLRIVAFLQDPGSGHILGAAARKL